MRKLAGLCVSVSVLVATISCGSSPSSPSGGGGIARSCSGGSFSGTMTATISGRSFTATCLVAGTFVKGIMSLGGTDVSASNSTTYQDITFAVDATGPGTYSFAPLSNGLPNPNNAAYSIGGSQFWNAGGTAGSGTVTFTVLSATSATGTFSFEMVAGPGGSGSKSVTNGSFSITF